MAKFRIEGPARPFGQQASQGNSGPQVGQQEDDEQDREQQPRQRPLFVVPPPSPLSQAYGQHFGQQQKALDSVNNAMSNAAGQWHDAYQMDASRAHQQSMQNDLLNAGIQMKQMDLQRDREKSGLLRGLLSGISGNSGFTIDGKGNFNRY